MTTPPSPQSLKEQIADQLWKLSDYRAGMLGGLATQTPGTAMGGHK